MNEPTGFDLARLAEIVDACTNEYRKGPERVTSSVGGLTVQEVFAMPSVEVMPSDVVPVDMHFVVVGVNKERAEPYKAEIEDILTYYPEPERWKGGPSYIEAAGVFGDQGFTLRLYALGHVLGLWKVMIPENLGITGEQAHEMAGAGFVYKVGLRGKDSG